MEFEFKKFITGIVLMAIGILLLILGSFYVKAIGFALLFIGFDIFLQSIIKYNG